MSNLNEVSKIPSHTTKDASHLGNLTLLSPSFVYDVSSSFVHFHQAILLSHTYLSMNSTAALKTGFYKTTTDVLFGSSATRLASNIDTYKCLRLAVSETSVYFIALRTVGGTCIGSVTSSDIV